MIPPEIMDAILDQHSAIVGKTGSGKTFTAKGEVEYLLERLRRVCVVDPTGAWWGLRSSKSGKSAGYPVVVFGGDHADVPITRERGARLAEIIASGNFPSIVDLSGFSRTAGRTFMTAFLNTLYEKNRSALNLVIDESDLYAPQRPLADSKLMLNAMENIVSRGRIRGLRIMMITQRPAKLHKDCLTQVNSITMMRVLSPQDRNALKAWVSEQGEEARGKEIIASLPRLPVGTGWLWAPEEDFLEQVKFPTIKTFDSSRAPDADETRALIKFADVDLTSLAGMLEEKKPEAKGRAKSPATKAPVIDVAKIRNEAFDDGFDKGQAKGFDDGVAHCHAEMIKRIKEPITSSPENRPLQTGASQRVSLVNGRESVMTSKTLPLDASGENNIGPSRRPLITLVKMHPAKLTEPQWASLTGMKRSGTWSTYKSRLNQAGFIEKHGDLFTASQSGIEAMGGSIAKPQTVEEVIDLWRKAVGPAAKLFNILLQDFPDGRTKEQLAYAADMALSGTFSTYLSRLNSNNLITKNNGEYSISAWLYIKPNL